MGMVWLQCSNALEPLRCRHVVKIGHVSHLQRFQCTGALEASWIRKRLSLAALLDNYRSIELSFQMNDARLSTYTASLMPS